MAKKKQSKSNESETLQHEKESKINWLQLLKDERTHKVLGTFCLMISIVLFVSFTSYLFTWEDDFDQVVREGNKMFWGTDTEVDNLMGTFGAFISHLFIYKGFGVASFLFCTLFFIAGVNLLFGQKVFSLFRNLKYLIIGMPVISISLSAFLGHQSFAWGGNVGKMSTEWLFVVIGKFGTYALVICCLLSFLIWRFNPAFGNLLKNDKTNESDPQQDALTPGNDISTMEEIEPSTELKQEPIDLTPQEKSIPEMIEEQEDDIPEETTSNQSDTPSDLELEINKQKTEASEQAEPEPVKKTVLKPYDPVLDLKDYKYPSVDLLENHGSEKIVQDPQELENNKNQIISTLKNYDITIQKISATVGPTVTLYEIIPAAGVRISKIKNLEDDIALSLAALGIRIIAPIPGKGTIGIEVPNARKTIVSMRTLLSADKFTKNSFALPIAIGKKIDNENFIVDLANMPHLLMAGATGQGKSVGLNAILVSLLYSKHPSQLKFVLVDPKKVELSIYKSIEKHFLAKLPGEEDAIITDTKKVVHTLNALCIEMDNRYDLLKEAGVRNIREYNEKFAKRVLSPEKGHQFLPFIVLVVDEFADLIMTAGKEVEMPIARLAQLARAVGIHLIIATQRPSVNIITGTIKANFPARIAFKVSSKIDSRTILDAGGAEQLIGKGDMLISYGGEIVRLQCAFVDTPEVDKIVDFISDQRGYPQAFMLPEYIDEKDNEGKDFDPNEKDPLFEDAARLIVASQSGSTSLLQRKMKLGYNRAGRLMDQLEATGIVGPSQGSKVRDVLIKTEAELMQLIERLG